MGTMTPEHRQKLMEGRDRANKERAAKKAAGEGATQRVVSLNTGQPQVQPPADVEQQPEAPEGDGKEQAQAGAAPVPEGGAMSQPVVPYVHQNGFRRVVNDANHRTEVHVDIFIDAPERTVMGTTVFPSDIWSNLIAAVGR